MIMIKKYMKIKFNSDDELPLNKMVKMPTMTIVFRGVFHEQNKYYPKAFIMNGYLNYE